MKVHEIMTAHARCVAPDNTLVEAAGLMRQLDVGALPVCDNDRLAGMITDRDIVLRGVADGRQVDTAIVQEVMSQGVFYIFADQEIEEAVSMMEEKQIRRLPVLNREKRMVGIVSLGDMALSANPAFSGMALKEVSQTAAGRMQGGRTPSSVQRERRAEDQKKTTPKRATRRRKRGAAAQRAVGKSGLRRRRATVRSATARTKKAVTRSRR